jgi:DNA-binding MarR family transcriptional regulator
MIAPFSVTPVQGMILNFLYEEDKVSSRRLGDRIQLDSATLTGILDRLEGMEFINRLSNPDDRRAILVCLTEKGRELGLKLHRNMEDANRDFLKSLSEEEETILRNLLVKIREQ